MCGDKSGQSTAQSTECGRRNRRGLCGSGSTTTEKMVQVVVELGLVGSRSVSLGLVFGQSHSCCVLLCNRQHCWGFAMSTRGGNVPKEEEALTADSIAGVREAQTTISNLRCATSYTCGQVR